MTGQAYINNRDISFWGASFSKGAYEALLKPASGNVRLNERTVNVPFWISGTSESDYLAKYEAFLEEVTSGLITLKVPALKKTYKLIYSDCASYGHYNLTKGKIILKFKEPNPTDREFL